MIYSNKTLSQSFKETFFYKFIPKKEILKFSTSGWKIIVLNTIPNKELTLKKLNSNEEIQIGFNLLNLNFFSEENYINLLKKNNFFLIKKENDTLYFDAS